MTHYRIKHHDRVPLYTARMCRDYLSRFGTLAQYREACVNVERIELDPTYGARPRGANFRHPYPWRTA